MGHIPFYERASRNAASAADMIRSASEESKSVDDEAVDLLARALHDLIGSSYDMDAQDNRDLVPVFNALTGFLEEGGE